MLSEEEVFDLLKAKFDEDVRAFHDYGPSELARAFWVGYQRGVTDSRLDVEAAALGVREDGD